MTTPTPVISVCLPTFNRVNLLQECLPTILRQTCKEIEVLVADNCSTDGTANFMAQCRDPRVRYYRHAQNLGPYPNMNYLLEQAKSQYVCILHDDDLYAPDFLACGRELLDQYPRVSLVHCAVREINSQGQAYRLLKAYPTTRVVSGRKEFVRFLEGHNICCSTVMMRRTVLQQVGSFETQYICADFLMWLKLALAGDVAYLAKPLVKRRVHAETVSNSLDPAWWRREFVGIVERGFALAVDAYPEVTAQRQAIMRRAPRAQGRRFLVAALSCTVHGRFELARDYASVIEQFRATGAPAYYSWLARWLANRPGQVLLAPVRRLRQTQARRLAVMGGRR